MYRYFLLAHHVAVLLGAGHANQLPSLVAGALQSRRLPPFLHNAIGPLLIYLYKRPTATETHGNHIFCLKKSTNLLYGMNLVWNGPWLT